MIRTIFFNVSAVFLFSKDGIFVVHCKNNTALYLCNKVSVARRAKILNLFVFSSILDDVEVSKKCEVFQVTGKVSASRFCDFQVTWLLQQPPRIGA